MHIHIEVRLGAIIGFAPESAVHIIVVKSVSDSEPHTSSPFLGGRFNDREVYMVRDPALPRGTGLGSKDALIGRR